MPLKKIVQVKTKPDLQVKNSNKGHAFIIILIENIKSILIFIVYFLICQT